MRPLRGDRLLHFLILCVAAGCALWVQVAVLGLQATVETKEHNLHDFLTLSQGVASSRSADPEKVAVRLGKLLENRSWESTFAELCPEVVVTGSGALLRLVKRNDKEGRGQDAGQDAGRHGGQHPGQQAGRKEGWDGSQGERQEGGR